MDASNNPYIIDDLPGLAGSEVALSYWLEIDQDRVNAFGAATNHTHWLHTDPERASAEGPYGGTLAHGFLLSSLVSHFTDSCQLRPRDAAFALNYGMDKVRFMRPVPTTNRAGQNVKVRDRITLMNTSQHEKGLKVVNAHTLEIDSGDGEPVPAAYAEVITIWVRRKAA